ncbi:hypothetical protein ACI2IY_15030 [Lysobacter enzymogenes]|uniref:hypothetical protein n=1 Tax=Lysobacter enzymogenes TaxID=69 RepID=UPI00384A86A3
MDGLASKQAWWLGVSAFAMGGAVASVAYGLSFEWAEGLKKAGVGPGDLADWAAVLVNIIVALSVFVLSSRTNRLAKDANESESRIHSETQRQRDREGRLLLVAFRLEIKHYIYYLKRCRAFIKEGGQADRFKKHREHREAFLREVKALRLDTIKSNADRIHLPGSICSWIAMR